MHELQEALQSFAYPCAARDCKLRVQGASCMALHDNFLTGSRRCALHRFRINSITFIGMLTGRENGKAFWILHFFFPQIAIAIGVLTSNTGGGRRTTLADWTWHQGAIAGSEDAVPLLCHHRVPL